MLKYHVQTSGRSLHAREIQFNDIRTTLQAMYALFDSCSHSRSSTTSATAYVISCGIPAAVSSARRRAAAAP
jgi:methylmalonyl-CoA mutase N-terminal domain/subunit